MGKTEALATRAPGIAGAFAVHRHRAGELAGVGQGEAGCGLTCAWKGHLLPEDSCEDGPSLRGPLCACEPCFRPPQPWVVAKQCPEASSKGVASARTPEGAHPVALISSPGVFVLRQ